MNDLIIVTIMKEFPSERYKSLITMFVLLFQNNIQATDDLIRFFMKIVN